ncbi:hypothetical protein [uncultured Kordia sp.]|uniref:hypothetical protein n=1 Tax=uncultured Kordia sp. TaxID=507699 RepID=UPI00262FBE50|nr:hypothetical protein [uncultured Kordia sp.]
MNRILKILPSLALYGLGLASFFFLDIYISTADYSKEFISQWAFYKSSIFILGGFCILGFDQVMVREPKLHFYIKKKFLFQSFLLSVIGTTLVWIFYPIERIWLFFIILNLFSITVFLSGIFRANQKYTIAQLATNGWKIVLVIIFFLVAQKQMLSFLGISLAVICLTLIVIYTNLYRAPEKDAVALKYEDYRKTGVAFFLHNMTLTSAVYGEQFIINLYGNDAISSELFMYFAIFSPIILSANGFIGFIIGPKLRAKETVTRKDYNSLQLKLIIFAIVMATISFVVGIFLLDRFKNVSFSEINLWLTLAVLITCMIRTVYTTSSLYLGVFASNKHLYKTAGLNWSVLIAYIILILVVLITGMDTNVLVVGIAGLTALHWTMRLIISHTYAIKFFDNEKH